MASVGIDAAYFDLPAARRMRSRLRLATSAKLALQRAATVAVRRGERRIHAGHLLHGVLAAEHRRVPRALEIAGIDGDELRRGI